MSSYDTDCNREYDSYHQEAIDKYNQMCDRNGRPPERPKAFIPQKPLSPSVPKTPCSVCGNLFTVKTPGDINCRVCVKLKIDGLTRMEAQEMNYIGNVITAQRIIDHPVLHGDFKVRAAKRVIAAEQGCDKCETCGDIILKGTDYIRDMAKVYCTIGCAEHTSVTYWDKDSE